MRCSQDRCDHPALFCCDGCSENRCAQHAKACNNCNGTYCSSFDSMCFAAHECNPAPELIAICKAKEEFQ